MPVFLNDEATMLAAEDVELAACHLSRFVLTGERAKWQGERPQEGNRRGRVSD